MNNETNGLSCVIGCWLAALVAGIICAALLMVMGGFAFTPAAFFGLLLFVLVGAFLSYAICGGNKSAHAHGTGVAAAGAAGAAAVATGAAASGGSGSASTSSAGAGSAAASASSDAVVSDASAGGSSVGGGRAASAGAPAAGIASVQGGTTLSGEEELAGRKGEWKYEGDAVKKPAAKKPAAKKPAAQKAATAKKPAKAAAGAAKTAKAPAKKSGDKPAQKPVAKDGKPELLKKARAGGPDDLKQIKGVGPKMEGMLHTMGVFHFDQVASWRKAEVQWVDDNLDGFNGRVARDEWVKQAKILAKGGVTEFSKKVDKGGVY